MTYLLDTNVISETRKPKPHRGAMAWIRSVVPGDLAVCAFTLGEIQFGIELTRPRDSAKAAEIERWLDELQDSIRIIDVSGDSYRTWARIIRGKSSELRDDGLIAAVAITHGFAVATRNVKDFHRFNVQVLNPFQHV